MTSDHKVVRDVYIELIRNESRILTERLRSMLTFQGLIFTAVGVAAGQRLFVLALLLAFVAGLFCVPWSHSVRLSYRGCEEKCRDYDKLKPTDAPPLDAYAVKAWEFWLLPEVFLPLAVAVTWLLVFAVVVYYWQYAPLSPTR